MLSLFYKMRKGYPEQQEDAYLVVKNPRASGARLGPQTPRLPGFASLARLRCAPSAKLGLQDLGPPLTQILDPHLTCIFLVTFG